MTDEPRDQTDDRRTPRPYRYTSYTPYVPVRPSAPAGADGPGPAPPDPVEAPAAPERPPAAVEQAPAGAWPGPATANGNGHTPAYSAAPYGEYAVPGGPAPDAGSPEGGAIPAGRGWDRDRSDAPRRGGGIGRILRNSWPLLLLALTKSKWLLAIFKLKAFSTFATMLVSIGAYALFFGLPFAIGFVALLFIHEMGHAIILKRQGVRATAPLFIPFMGAVIGMREMPKNVYAEAQMALGGPIFGSLGALACLILWQVTGSPLFVALAYMGLWLNLFNLIPVSPLDGGRAMGAISPWGWILGLVVLVALFLRLQSLFLGFILLVGGMEVFNRWRSRDVDRAYYEVTGRQRLLVAAVYFGLAAVLALSMAALEPTMIALRPR